MTLRQPSSPATPTAQQPNNPPKVTPYYPNTIHKAAPPLSPTIYYTQRQSSLAYCGNYNGNLSCPKKPEGCSGGKATQIAVGQTKSFSFIKNNQAPCECVRASVAVSVESALRKTQAQRVLFLPIS